MTFEPFLTLVIHDCKHKHIYKINISCDKYKNEMKFHMLMFMNACAHEMQMSNAMLNTRVLQPLPLEISSQDLKDLPFLIKGRINLT